MNINITYSDGFQTHRYGKAARINLIRLPGPPEIWHYFIYKTFGNFVDYLLIAVAEVKNVVKVEDIQNYNPYNIYNSYNAIINYAVKKN